MPRSEQRAWILSLWLVLLAAMGSWPGLALAEASDGATGQGRDSDRVLEMGLMPMAVPSGPVSEAMRRDRVLARQLRKLGVTARYHAFLKGPDGNRLILENKLDGFMAGDLPALAVACQTQVVICSLVFQGFSALVTTRPLFLGSLDGQNIGYARGSVAHYGLYKALEQAGTAPGDLTLTPMDATEMTAALASGQVTAVAAWEPFVTMILHRFPQAVVLHRTLYHGYLYFTRQAVEQHPKAVRLLIAAQLRAMAWMRAKRANLLIASRWALAAQAALSGQEPDISPQQYAALVRNDLLDAAPVPEIPSNETNPGGELEARFNFLKKHGMIPQETDFSRVVASFDRGMVQEVLAQPALYGLDQFDYQD